MKDIIYPLSVESLDFKKSTFQLSYILCEIIPQTGMSHQGVLALVSTDAISQNRIIPNEKTYPRKQNKILASFLTEKMQRKPVLLTYDAPELDLNTVKKTKPSFVFFSEGITYRLWEIKEQEKVHQLSKQLNAIEHLIVADGHHRLAAVVEYHTNKNTASEVPCFLALLVEKSHILLQGFNKLLTRIGMCSHKLIELMGQSFDVQNVGKFEKACKRNPAIYLGKVWYSLSLKDTLKTSPHFNNPACYVHRFLFEKVLGINNDAIEDNVISISHQTPVKELEQWVNKGTYHSAIYIPSMNETEFIRHVKSGCLFPQNTTFFSPKINHDLFLFLLHKQQMVLDLQNREHVA